MQAAARTILTTYPRRDVCKVIVPLSPGPKGGFICDFTVLPMIMAGNLCVRQGLDYEQCKCVLQDFKKAGASTLYMPVWSWAELDAGRHLHGLEEDETLALYEKWGGSARYVLPLARNASRQRDLGLAILAASPDAIYKAVVDIDSADEVGGGCLAPPCTHIFP